MQPLSRTYLLWWQRLELSQKKGLMNHEEHEGHEEQQLGRERAFSGEAAFMLFKPFMVEITFVI